MNQQELREGDIIEQTSPLDVQVEGTPLENFWWVVVRYQDHLECRALDGNGACSLPFIKEGGYRVVCNIGGFLKKYGAGHVKE